MKTEYLCPNCINSIRCSTWAEWKCLARRKRIPNYKDLISCEFYRKRSKDFKERPCQCEDCLKHGAYYDERYVDLLVGPTITMDVEILEEET